MGEHGYLHPLLFFHTHCWVWFTLYLVSILVVVGVCWWKYYIHTSFDRKLKIPVANFHKLYFWTLQYHCTTRFCFQAQLPFAEKFLEWCSSRARFHREGIPVPEITIQVVGSAHWLSLAGLSSTAAVLTILQKLDGDQQFKIVSRTTIISFFLLLLAMTALLLVGVVDCANRLETAAVHWVITTALHALSPVELAFGVATGIRLHTFQQALQGKGPDATEEWGNMEGSGQEDGTACYTQIFTQGVDPLSGVAALYPGDLPLKALATGLIMVLSSIGIYFSDPKTDITAAVIAVMVLYLGTAALFIQYVFNLRLAASKLKDAAERAYNAAGIAYWVPRWPAFGKVRNLGRFAPNVLRNILAREPCVVVNGASIEADLSSILAGHLTFEEFAQSYFPTRLSVLWWPIQKLTLPFKSEPAETPPVTNTIPGYRYSPEATLQGLESSIAAMDSTARSPNGSNLIIFGRECGERKVLISNIGSFDLEAFSRSLGEAVVQDLLALSKVVEDKTKIPARFSVNWWLAQGSIDEFIGTVTKYRSLAKDTSYAPGIFATLDHLSDDALQLHRLIVTRHAKRFGTWIPGKGPRHNFSNHQCSNCPDVIGPFHNQILYPFRFNCAVCWADSFAGLCMIAVLSPLFFELIPF